jgi:hypothetical protein
MTARTIRPPRTGRALHLSSNYAFVISVAGEVWLLSRHRAFTGGREVELARDFPLLVFLSFKRAASGCRASAAFCHRPRHLLDRFIASLRTARTLHPHIIACRALTIVSSPFTGICQNMEPRQEPRMTYPDDNSIRIITSCGLCAHVLPTLRGA